jgi:excisionase family DNA binding protein
MSPLLRIQDVAELLDIGPDAVRRWADERSVPVYTIGPKRDWRFKAEDIQSALASQPPS